MPHAEYLTCTENGSSKFYMLVPLPSGEFLRGYGPIGTSGTWKKIGAAEAGKKRREKLGKGYVTESFSQIPRRTYDKAQAELQRATGGGKIDPQTGAVVLPTASTIGPSARPTAPRPRASRGLNIKTWF